MILHSQRNRIDHNQYEDRVFKWLRCDEPPNFILYPMLRDVPSNRFRFQRKFNAISLIFIELTIFVLSFAFVLKRNDNETNEYVNHEESNYDNVDDVIGSDHWTKIVNGTAIFCLRIDRNV